MIILVECCKKQSEEHRQVLTKILTADEIIISPEKYNGTIAVSGTVIKIHESTNIFLLGCEDACIFLPVEYKKEMPEADSKIIVYGKLEKQKDGKYIILGEKLKRR